MKIAIVSGKDEGPTKINAFDNALTDAGIGDVNLIKVSSMLGGNTEILPLPSLKAGSMINCVLSTITSSNKGEKITSMIAVAIGDELGCVVEKTGINENIEKMKEEAIFMVEYMMRKRNVKVDEIIVEESTHVVEEIGSVVSSVIYLD